MGTLNKVYLDPKIQVEGRWFPYPECPEIECRIARFNNPEYRKEMRRLLKPHERTVGRRGTIDQDTRDNLVRIAVSRTVLIDWKGITEDVDTGKKDDDGKPIVETREIPYSNGKAMEFFTDPGLVDFYDWILQISMDANSFRDEAQEDAEKN